MWLNKPERATASATGKSADAAQLCRSGLALLALLIQLSRGVILILRLLRLRRHLTRLLLRLLALLRRLLLRRLVIRVGLAGVLGVSRIGLVIRHLCAVRGLIPALLGLLSGFLSWNLLYRLRVAGIIDRDA
ncbi:Uncharacterised protein [Mycobacteroides abscessus subsp. abscessus]|nr:Uncharacterised protein [Mycobacteroides abscessus subsp. abscessus]